jgi:hypothetical protein
LTKRAVSWSFTIDHSAIQAALECGYENSLGRGWLFELSNDKYHILASSIGGKTQKEQS